MGGGTTTWSGGRLRWGGGGLAVAALVALAAVPVGAPDPPPPSVGRGSGGLAVPVTFEANRGQADPAVRFLARRPGASLYLTPTEAVVAPAGAGAGALRLGFAGARPTEPVGVGRRPGVVNYLVGDDPARWRTGVPTYAKVAYRGLYPGIDVVFYGRGSEVEYDAVVAPGADPGVLRLAVGGAEDLALGPGGELVATLAGGARVTQRAPVAYQQEGDSRRAVAARFALVGPREVGFALGPYDGSRPLVVDPVLTYASFLGGGGEDSVDHVAVDGAGNAYLAGATDSRQFPVTAGSPKAASDVVFTDAVVVKLSPTGEVVYATLFGGATGWDAVEAIAVDATGAAHLGGRTAASDFPVSTGSYDLRGGGRGIVVARLDPTGARLTQAFHLGPLDTRITGIAVDGAGNDYVAGDTSSEDFATTPGSYQPLPTSPDAGGEGVLFKVNAAGTALVWSTYTGGAGGEGVGVDAGGSPYVVGNAPANRTIATTPGAFQPESGGATDAWVARFDPTGSALVWATYLGGAETELVWDMALDATGVYLTGSTMSRDNLLTVWVDEGFPTTPGAFQPEAGGPLSAFVAKLSLDGARLIYGTYLGGGRTTNPDGWHTESAQAIAVDPATGVAYVTGYTDAPDFPTTPDAFQPSLAGAAGDLDAFVTALNPAGSALVHSSYLGGIHNDQGMGIAADGAGGAWVMGRTSSCDFPAAGDPVRAQLDRAGLVVHGDSFVAKVVPGTPAGAVGRAPCGLAPVPPGPGALAGSFGQGGVVRSDLAGGGDEIARAVVVQPDGRLVVGGGLIWRWEQGSVRSREGVVARYLPDGSLDASFGVGGVARTTALGGVGGLALDPRGGQVRVVAGGYAPAPDGLTAGEGDLAVARFGPDGALDPSFGVDGVARVDLGTRADAAEVVLVEPDGSVLAAGGGLRFALVRFGPDGALDPAFGTGGVVTTEVAPPGQYDAQSVRIRSVVRQPDGRLVVAGHGDYWDFTLVRYLPDGRLDASFGAGGIVHTNLETFAGGRNLADRALALALVGDGRLLVGGWSDNGDYRQFALARYLPDGTLDPSFGTGGFVRAQFPSHVAGIAGALAVQADGRVVQAGTLEPPGYRTEAGPGPALARYLPDGRLDPDYGAGGVAIHGGRYQGVGSPWELSAVHAVALLDDGSLVGVGGITEDGYPPKDDFGLWRFQAETPTSLAFTPASPPRGQHSDTVVVEARLSDWTGAPVVGAELRVELAGAGGARAVTATTDDHGLARAALVLGEAPGDYALSVSYSGQPRVQAGSWARMAFVVEREDTALALTVAGSGSKRTLSARLHDADTPGAGVGGRTLVFLADGTEVGRATTAADGTATLTGLPAAYQGGPHTYEARFAGDSHWRPSTATATT